MTHQSVIPWTYITSEMMSDDYRSRLVEVALNHLSVASPELRRSCHQILNEQIHIPGFRSFGRAHPSLQRRTLIKSILEIPAVARLVISVWAEARENLIEELRNAAIEAGIDFRPGWIGEESHEEFAVRDPDNSFMAFVESYVAEQPEDKADDLHLAAFWLNQFVAEEASSNSNGDEITELSQVKNPSSEPSVPPRVESPATADTIPSAPVDMMTESLTELLEKLQERKGKYERAQSAVVQVFDELRTDVERHLPDNAHRNLSSLTTAITDWKTHLTAISNLVEGLVQRLTHESAQRPDLAFSIAVELAANERPAPSSIDLIVERLEQMLAYDRERDQAIEQLGQMREMVIVLEEEVAVWEGAQLDNGDASVDERSLTLEEARDEVTTLSKRHNELKKQLIRLKELSWQRIQTAIEGLREFQVDEDSLLFQGNTLAELADTQRDNWSGEELRHLETAVVARVEEEMLQHRSVQTGQLARELQEGWEQEAFILLLEQLADEKRDVESLLLLLSGKEAHPPTSPFALKQDVVRALLRGIARLSQKTEPYALFHLLAPALAAHWQAAEPAGQAELYAVFLAAHYSNPSLVPVDFLWNVSQPSEFNWPREDMSEWQELWAATCNEQPVQFVSGDDQQNSRNHLDNARKKAQEQMAREHGDFRRLNSMESARHHTLMRESLMLILNKYLLDLEEKEHELEQARDFEIAPRLQHLHSYIEQTIRTEIDSKALEERYQTEARTEGVRDSNPFHRDTCLRILNQCSADILAYGEALLSYWQEQTQNVAVIHYDALRTELKNLPSLTPLSQLAVDQIELGPTNDAVQDPAIARIRAAEVIVEDLLQQDIFALHLPNIVGYLTSARLQWESLLPPLLADFANPADAQEAAARLLELESPDQVLLLTQHLPLDIQKAAQTLQREKEKSVEQLESELLKLGGDTADLQQERRLGRWHLLLEILENRVEQLRQEREQRRARIEQEATALRQRIFTLQQELFSVSDRIPPDILQLVLEGLNITTKETLQPESFSAITTYLDEIRYRLDRDSWPLSSIHEANSRLSQDVHEDADDIPSKRSAEEVLDLLQREELQALGLDETKITGSAINTRTQLLEEWLTVRDLPAFLSDSLRMPHRMHIDSLFRQFAQMNAMRQRRTPDGRPLAEEYPVVFAHWELIYPKTKMLDTNCVLIALPGTPPSSRDLRSLEDILEERKWLDYFFVFLFVPGCTATIKERLQRTYEGQRLLILDETALLEMVLAEVRYPNPVGRLRPLMLQSWGEENVDVFTINKPVHERIAIFVGRDALIRRVASSGENYAIYGGRRIGKSSVLKAIAGRIDEPNTRAIYFSFEGREALTDTAGARALARRLHLESPVESVDDFRFAVQEALDNDTGARIVLLIDEVDRYIVENKERHLLIETLRTLSDQYESRFRVIIAGFMSLYDCLQGRGPYTPNSDPWQRMLNDNGPLRNLRPASAEGIVRQGFEQILGWKLEHHAIPQRIVERTGGHPAFVQHFCLKLQKRVKNRVIGLEDVEAVFDDPDPDNSFIANVRKTLELNLEDPVTQYLILWLAHESGDKHKFTLDEVRELAELGHTSITEDHLMKSIDRLKVTSVIREQKTDVFEFSVPDYPAILNRLGDTKLLNQLEDKLQEYLE